MSELLDALALTDGIRLAVVNDDGEGRAGLAAVPQTRDGDGHWVRAKPGDGVADALLDVVSHGSLTQGRFEIRSWTSRIAKGERPIAVDQTNESVIVGDSAVVKWATNLQDGPHPALRRIGTLREVGFEGMPAPWGLVSWRDPDGAETLVAYVDEYLPDAVDGWTWAVDLVTGAARNRRPDAFAAAAADVGTVIAELHVALSATASVASSDDARRWCDAAIETLETVCALDDSASVECARARRGEIEQVLTGLGSLAGTAVIEGHGDLHVGQVLRSRGSFVVTDFDGNPVLTAAQRMLPIPAVLDVAGMTQSLAHAAIVAGRHAALDATALRDVDRAGRTAFLAAYSSRLTALGKADLYGPTPLRAFRTQQVLNEIIYAARYLPRWMYVPDAALPALLDEGEDA